MLIVSALAFVYSLGLVTDLYDSFYYAIPEPAYPDESYVTGARILYDIQPFNKELTTAAIILIICCVLSFLTNTHSRRKYYIGNFISIGVSAVANIGISVWAILNIAKYKNQFLTEVDFEQFKSWADRKGYPYTESTFWFDAGFVVCALLILAALLLIGNLIWKLKLMKAEARLINEGLEETAV